MRNTKTAAATLQQREAVAYPTVIIQSDAAAPRYERGNYTYKPAR